MLLPELHAMGQGDLQHAQIGQPPPESGAMEAAFIDGRGLRRSDVRAANLAVVARGLLIRHAIAIDVLSGEPEKMVTRITFVGEYESRASR